MDCLENILALAASIVLVWLFFMGLIKTIEIVTLLLTVTP